MGGITSAEGNRFFPLHECVGPMWVTPTMSAPAWEEGHEGHGRVWGSRQLQHIPILIGLKCVVRLQQSCQCNLLSVGAVVAAFEKARSYKGMLRNVEGQMLAYRIYRHNTWHMSHASTEKKECQYRVTKEVRHKGNVTAI